MKKSYRMISALVLSCFFLFSCSSVSVRNDSAMPVKESPKYSAEKQGERMLVKGVSAIAGLGLGLAIFNENNTPYRVAAPLAAVSVSTFIYDLVNVDRYTDAYKTGFLTGMAAGAAAALIYFASNNYYSGAHMNDQILMVSIPVTAAAAVIFGHSCGSILGEFFDVSGIKF